MHAFYAENISLAYILSKDCQLSLLSYYSPTKHMQLSRKGDVLICIYLLIAQETITSLPLLYLAVTDAVMIRNGNTTVSG